MRLLLILLLVCAYGCQDMKNNHEAISISKSKSHIINGEVPSFESEPGIAGSMVALTKSLNELQTCSGVLIAPNALLTAAHCIVQEGNIFDNQFALLGPKFNGKKNGNTISFENAVAFKKVIVHEKYLYPSTYADLAIVILADNVPLEYIPASIYTGLDLKNYSVPAYISGSSLFNSSNINDSFEQMLIGLKLNSELRFQGNAEIAENTISSSILFRQVSIIPFRKDYTQHADKISTFSNLGSIESGDSGGGLFIEFYGNHLLVGINSFSFSEKSGAWSYIANATKVGNYKEWLIAKLEENQIALPTFIEIATEEKLGSGLNKQSLSCNIIAGELYNLHSEDLKKIMNTSRDSRCELVKEFYQTVEPNIKICKSFCPDSGATKNFCSFYEKGRSKLRYKIVDCDF